MLVLPEGQALALITSHLIMLMPVLSPVTSVAEAPVFAMFPVPVSMLHKPVPVVGLVALSARLGLFAHKVWLGVIIFTGPLTSSTTTVTSDTEVQVPSVIDQLNTLLLSPSPVTAVVVEPGLLIVPEPDTNDQEPVPRLGVLPVKSAVGVEIQITWLAPASALSGGVQEVTE